MHTLRNCFRVGSLGSFLIVTGCSGSPSALMPTGPSGVNAAVSTIVTADSEAEALSRTAATSAPTDLNNPAAAPAPCKPRFKRTPSKESNRFFILTIDFPSGCQWFARDSEEGGNYWELTVPDYELRNRQKYTRGFTGVGRQDIGVYFSAKLGYGKHRTLVLDVCSGSSCDPGSQKWVWKYTIRL